MAALAISRGLEPSDELEAERVPLRAEVQVVMDQFKQLPADYVVNSVIASTRCRWANGHAP